MVFDKEIAKKLKILTASDIEASIKLLLDYVLAQKANILDNPNVTDAEMRQFQGQRQLITELKDYKQRLRDAVTREKEKKLEGD